MLIREAIPSDITQLQIIRNAVKENTLSDPGLITDNDYKEFLSSRGKGWVAEVTNKIVGFSIVDLHSHNIWALFVHPEYEDRGIGRLLHNRMLDWYFSQTKTKAWLSTSPGTRAESFYRKLGWVEIGTHEEGEIKFEMTCRNWKKYKNGSVSEKRK